jgi:uncharacterized membrane protein
LTRGRRRDERGAVAVFLAVTVSLLVIVGAFAVDLGMQRVVRRDMQALADVVALDLARELDGRTHSALAPETLLSDPDSALSQSLGRNSTTLGDNLTVTVAWGTWDGSVFDASADPPTAVRVMASADVGFAFTNGRGGATRTAYAESSTTACHKLGSVAVAMQSGDSALLAPLNDLLGLNLSLLSYQNLAGVGVSVADLVATGRVGTATSLLTTTTSFADLLSATAAALNSEKPSGYAASLSALDALVEIQGTVPAVALGQILNMGQTDSAALETDLNVLDLLAGAIQVANGAHAVAIPMLQTGVPGLGNQFTGELYIQEPAKLGCGAPNSEQARASTSQLVGDVGLDFVNLPTVQLKNELDLGLVKGTLQTAKATGTLSVNLGLAQSQLIDPPDVHCGEGTVADPHTMAVSISSGLTTYALSTQVTLSGSIKVGLLGVDVDAVVDVSLSSPPTGAPSTVTLSIPPNDTTPVETGSPVAPLSNLTASISTITAKESLTGLPLSLSNLTAVTNAILNALLTGDQSFANKALAPLAANIDSMLVGPLAELLGIRIGGADAFAVSTACNVPHLRG